MKKIAGYAVETEQQRQQLLHALSGRKMPFTVSVSSGVKRSFKQNKLQRLWCNELQEQGDQGAEEYRGYSKLTFGVPILLSEDDDFAEGWDRVMKGLGYETKLGLMMEPWDFPVSRLMDTDQMTRYLTAMCTFFRSNGFVLTDPEEPAILRALREAEAGLQCEPA